MKTYNKTFLPESIEYNGEKYELNASISAGMSLNNTSVKHISTQLKLQGRKAVLVKVLPKQLKGRKDLYGKDYNPTQHIFTTVTANIQ